jgi:three-Cys-motif partner protein
MVEHRFGGDWTQEKLDSLKGYLLSYRAIFNGNPAARFFTTWYVDAFAGTGSIASPSSPAHTLPLVEASENEQKRFLDGSAKIALGLDSPFHKYLFIEESRKRADALSGMVREQFPSLLDRVTVQVEDANRALRDWCGTRNWSKERAVVFLDPYGMQVEWSTVTTLAGTKGVDLWYLFPFATRLLPNDQNIHESWAHRLDLLFGTPEWRERFYPSRQQETLFGPVDSIERDAGENNIQAFIEERLRTCFVGVAKSRILRNSTNSPLYALCFAASNAKGAAPALKIAQYLLSR